MADLVLIVDDEPGILTELSNILRDEGLRVVATGSGEEAIALYQRERPDAVFLDVWLPDRDGLEVLQALRRLDPTAAVIMMSGHGTATTAVKAIKLGAHDYLEKPLSYEPVMRRSPGARRSRRHGREVGAVPFRLEPPRSSPRRPGCRWSRRSRRPSARSAPPA